MKKFCDNSEQCRIKQLKEFDELFEAKSSTFSTEIAHKFTEYKQI